ncbi:MAG: hypothetical protein J6Z25_01160 [Opitutales bacterium]|nr:hypothetical protein [Opitutales bacterium]
MRKTGKGYRLVDLLENTNRIMKDSFWVGVYPGLEDADINHMLESIHQVLQG